MYFRNLSTLSFAADFPAVAIISRIGSAANVVPSILLSSPNSSDVFSHHTPAFPAIFLCYTNIFCCSALNSSDVFIV